jgi:hypothetical protein
LRPERPWNDSNKQNSNRKIKYILKRNITSRIKNVILMKANAHFLDFRLFSIAFISLNGWSFLHVR